MIPRFPKKKTAPRSQPSSVLSMEHDQDGTLTVTFHGGRTYAYDNVSTENFQKLRAASSKGEFLNTHIIPHHTFTRINALKPAREK